MKQIFYLAVTVFFIISCSSIRPEYNIEFNMPGFHGQWLKLNKFDGSGYVVVDSLLIDSTKKNILSGKVDQIALMYLSVEDQRGSVRLLVENGNYQISGNLREPVVNSSGPAQQQLNEYDNALRLYNTEMSELYQKYRLAMQENDESKTDSLIALLEGMDSKINEYDSLYIINNPASPTAVIALRNIFYRYDVEELTAMVGNIDKRLHQMEEFKFVSSKLENMKQVAVGKEYTDFGLETPDGAILNVSDVHHNNVLLIDFWAAWCGPCRVANPELVLIYDAYHGEGFEILGVSLDRDRENWLKAIKDDGLVWPQVSDLKFWNSAGAQLYGVSSIPHSVLVDKKGIIRAKNLSGQELRDKIEELLQENV